VFPDGDGPVELDNYAAAIEDYRVERTPENQLEAARRHYDAIGYVWRSPWRVRWRRARRMMALSMLHNQLEGQLGKVIHQPQ
jgi:hypothetical protein